MDRLFTLEFAPLVIVGDPLNPGQYKQQSGFVTDYQPVPNTNNVIWFTEHKLDMTGYLIFLKMKHLS